MTKLQSCAAGFMVFLSFGSMILRADDLPDQLRAKGSSETILAGIDVYNSTVKAVIAKLDPPTSFLISPHEAMLRRGTLIVEVAKRMCGRVD